MIDTPAQLRAEIESLRARLAEAHRRCNGSCDIELARRQVGPDGDVPGNARECAELWEREASRLEKVRRFIADGRQRDLEMAAKACEELTEQRDTAIRERDEAKAFICVQEAELAGLAAQLAEARGDRCTVCDDDGLIWVPTAPRTVGGSEESCEQPDACPECGGTKSGYASRVTKERDALLEVPGGMRHEPCWQTGSKLTKERDAAIRERDEAREEAARRAAELPALTQTIADYARRLEAARARPALTEPECRALTMVRGALTPEHRGEWRDRLLAGVAHDLLDRLLAPPPMAKEGQPAMSSAAVFANVARALAAYEAEELSEEQLMTALGLDRLDTREVVCQLRRPAAPSHQTCEGAARPDLTDEYAADLAARYGDQFVVTFPSTKRFAPDDEVRLQARAIIAFLVDELRGIAPPSDMTCARPPEPLPRTPPAPRAVTERQVAGWVSLCVDAEDARPWRSVVLDILADLGITVTEEPAS